MNITPLALQDVIRIEPVVHGDTRGFFMEAVNIEVLREHGIDFTIAQHNQSRSQKGVVRGLHFQWDKPLGKIIRVIHGRAFVVAVDIRKNSKTYGKWVGEELSDENKTILYVPFGFASGFYAYADDTELEYYYSALYNPDGESNILWNDERIGIEWPDKNPILSERDKNARKLTQWENSPESDLIV
ncbi:MAG TPA: dTDP-4-dehydrorhamnose 3,5-epimerase [Candidatus Paceibacterota bacterium]|nr:dTDP-4-dehydrorhamnose 3,5-epimerase [Candidatus Paceibacterota bacterium]